MKFLKWIHFNYMHLVWMAYLDTVRSSAAIGIYTLHSFFLSLALHRAYGFLCIFPLFSLFFYEDIFELF